jgi:site-specific DNA recombinase
VPRPVVYKLLRDRFAYGEFEFQGVVYPGKHEPLVTRALWQRVQDVLDGRGGRPYGKGQVHYNGLIKCGLCGASMTGEGVPRTLKSGERKVYEYLRCSMSGNGHGKRGCKVGRLNVQEVERLLGDLVESIAFEDDAVEVIRSELRASHEGHIKRVEATLASFRGLLTKAEESRRAAFRLALDAGLDGATLREQVERIEADVVRYQGEVRRLEGESRAYYEEGVRVIELAQRVHRIWVAQDSATKRAIIDCLVLNCTWDGVTLAPEWRSPFRLIAEGASLVESRGDRI